MKRPWFFLISALLLFSAISSRDTIASLDRAMVHAVGIDSTDDGYTVTLQVFRPEGAGTDTQLDPGKANIFVISAAAPTVEEAMSVCENRLGEFLFIGHCQVIVLGKDTELGEPERLFSYFLRSKESYMGVRLACAEGSAEELLSAELSEGAVAAQNIVNIIKRHTENSASVECTLLDTLSCGGGASVMPVLKLLEPSKKQSDSSESGSEPPQTVAADGAEVFVDGRRSMKLSSEECSALARFGSDIRSTVIEFDTPQGASAVTVRDDCFKTYAEKRGDRISVRFEIGVQIKNDQSLERLCPDSDALAEKCEEEIETRCRRLISRCLEEGADLFRICETVRSRWPQVWLDCGGDVREILSLCDIETEVICRIK